MREVNEEKRGFVMAMQAIERDGDTVEAAERHLNVARGDLAATDFTRGWKRACTSFIEMNTKAKEDR